MENLDKIYANKIAEEYAPKKTSKVIRLQKLDHKVKSPVLISSYSIGIAGALLLGSGMSILLSDFGPSGTLGTILGITLGLVGIIICGVNYPLYKKILKRRKEKYAFEITSLAKEIVDNN